jgi:hypothetical protein
MSAPVLTFTRYPNKHAGRQGEPISRPWEEWAAALSKHEARGLPDDGLDAARVEATKDGPAIVLGLIPAGKARRDSDVAEIHALGLDVEKQTDAQIANALKAIEGYEWIAYTTHKHAAACAGGGTRLRIILPLAVPISPSRLPQIYKALDALTLGVSDPKCRNASRLFFLPSTFDPAVAWTHRNAGAFLNADDLERLQPAARVVDLADDSGRLSSVELGSLLARCHSLFRSMREGPLKEFARRLADGRPLSDAGGRHEAIVDLTWHLATKIPEIPDCVIEALFAPSCDAMRAADPNSPEVAEAVRAYADAVAKQAARRDERAEQAQRGNESKYLEGEIEAIANAQRCTVEGLAKRWLVQRDSTYWVLTGSGDYHGPMVRDDAQVAVATLLKRAPVRLVEATQNGVRWRSLVELVRDHGSVAGSICSSLSAQRASFDDATGVFTEAVCRLRKFTPTRHEKIETWLRLFAGDLYEKLCDWLACVPDPDRALCAVYFAGVPGSGKTILALSLSSLWTTGGPCTLDSLLSDFNADLATCPVVLGDEYVAMWTRSGAPITQKLRHEIAVPVRPLSRKYKANTELHGYIRLVLAANNEHLLKALDAATREDLDAIAQRFFFLDASQDATDFMQAMSRDEKELWRTKMIPEHVLWLYQNRKVIPAGRFWVEGTLDRMHRLLMTSTKFNTLVCEFLVRYLMNPNPVDTRCDGLIMRDEGRLLVNAQAVIDAWEVYFPKSRTEPETAKIVAALRAISKRAKTRLRSATTKRQITFWIVDVDHLFAWSESNHIGDRETMTTNLGEPPDREPGEDHEAEAVDRAALGEGEN